MNNRDDIPESEKLQDRRILFLSLINNITFDPTITNLRERVLTKENYIPTNMELKVALKTELKRLIGEIKSSTKVNNEVKVIAGDIIDEILKIINRDNQPIRNELISITNYLRGILENPTNLELHARFYGNNDALLNQLEKKLEPTLYLKLSRFCHITNPETKITSPFAKHICQQKISFENFSGLAPRKLGIYKPCEPVHNALIGLSETDAATWADFALSQALNDIFDKTGNFKYDVYQSLNEYFQLDKFAANKGIETAKKQVLKNYFQMMIVMGAGNITSAGKQAAIRCVYEKLESINIDQSLINAYQLENIKVDNISRSHLKTEIIALQIQNSLIANANEDTDETTRQEIDEIIKQLFSNIRSLMNINKNLITKLDKIIQHIGTLSINAAQNLDELKNLNIWLSQRKRVESLVTFLHNRIVLNNKPISETDPNCSLLAKIKDFVLAQSNKIDHNTSTKELELASVYLQQTADIIDEKDITTQKDQQCYLLKYFIASAKIFDVTPSSENEFSNAVLNLKEQAIKLINDLDLSNQTEQDIESITSILDHIYNIIKNSNFNDNDVKEILIQLNKTQQNMTNSTDENLHALIDTFYKTCLNRLRVIIPPSTSIELTMTKVGIVSKAEFLYQKKIIQPGITTQLVYHAIELIKQYLNPTQEQEKNTKLELIKDIEWIFEKLKELAEIQPADDTNLSIKHKEITNAVSHLTLKILSGINYNFSLLDLRRLLTATREHITAPRDPQKESEFKKYYHIIDEYNFDKALSSLQINKYIGNEELQDILQYIIKIKNQTPKVEITKLIDILINLKKLIDSESPTISNLLKTFNIKRKFLDHTNHKQKEDQDLLDYFHARINIEFINSIQDKQLKDTILEYIDKKENLALLDKAKEWLDTSHMLTPDELLIELKASKKQDFKDNCRALQENVTSLDKRLRENLKKDANKKGFVEKVNVLAKEISKDALTLFNILDNNDNDAPFSLNNFQIPIIELTDLVGSANRSAGKVYEFIDGTKKLSTKKQERILDSLKKKSARLKRNIKKAENPGKSLTQEQKQTPKHTKKLKTNGVSQGSKTKPPSQTQKPTVTLPDTKPPTIPADLQRCSDILSEIKRSNQQVPIDKLRNAEEAISAAILNPSDARKKYARELADLLLDDYEYNNEYRLFSGLMTTSKTKQKFKNHLLGLVRFASDNELLPTKILKNILISAKTKVTSPNKLTISEDEIVFILFTQLYHKGPGTLNNEQIKIKQRILNEVANIFSTERPNQKKAIVLLRALNKWQEKSTSKKYSQQLNHYYRDFYLDRYHVFKTNLTPSSDKTLQDLGSTFLKRLKSLAKSHISTSKLFDTFHLLEEWVKDDSNSNKKSVLIHSLEENENLVAMMSLLNTDIPKQRANRKNLKEIKSQIIDLFNRKSFANLPIIQQTLLLNFSKKLLTKTQYTLNQAQDLLGYLQLLATLAGTNFTDITALNKFKSWDNRAIRDIHDLMLEDNSNDLNLFNSANAIDKEISGEIEVSHAFQKTMGSEEQLIPSSSLMRSIKKTIIVEKGTIDGLKKSFTAHAINARKYSFINLTHAIQQSNLSGDSEKAEELKKYLILRNTLATYKPEADETYSAEQLNNFKADFLNHLDFHPYDASKAIAQSLYDFLANKSRDTSKLYEQAEPIFDQLYIQFDQLGQALNEISPHHSLPSDKYSELEKLKYDLQGLTEIIFTETTENPLFLLPNTNLSIFTLIEARKVMLELLKNHPINIDLETRLFRLLKGNKNDKGYWPQIAEYLANDSKIKLTAIDKDNALLKSYENISSPAAAAYVYRREKNQLDINTKEGTASTEDQNIFSTYIHTSRPSLTATNVRCEHYYADLKDETLALLDTLVSNASTMINSKRIDELINYVKEKLVSKPKKLQSLNNYLSLRIVLEEKTFVNKYLTQEQQLKLYGNEQKGQSENQEEIAIGLRMKVLKLFDQIYLSKSAISDCVIILQLTNVLMNLKDPSQFDKLYDKVIERLNEANYKIQYTKAMSLCNNSETVSSIPIKNSLKGLVEIVDKSKKKVGPKWTPDYTRILEKANEIVDKRQNFSDTATTIASAREEALKLKNVPYGNAIYTRFVKVVDSCLAWIAKANLFKHVEKIRPQNPIISKFNLFADKVSSETWQGETVDIDLQGMLLDSKGNPINLPIEIWEKINNEYLTPASQRRFASTCKGAYSLGVMGNGNAFYNRFIRKRCEDVNALLLHVVRGEQMEAEKMIKADPSLLLEKGSVKDYSGRIIEGTALQIAIGSENFRNYGITMMYKNGEDEERMTEMILRNLREHHPNSEEIIRTQIDEQFPDGWEKAEQERVARDSQALKKVFDAVSKAKSSDDSEAALEEFRNYLKPKGVIKTGKHFNAQLLVEAFKLYNEDYGRFHGRGEKGWVIFCNIIGYIERFVPACYAQIFCGGVENRDFKFRGRRHDHFFYPLDSEPNFRLGFGCAVDIKYMANCGKFNLDNAPSSENVFNEDRKTKGGNFTDFVEQKTTTLQNIIKDPYCTLQNTPRIQQSP